MDNIFIDFKPFGSSKQNYEDKYFDKVKSQKSSVSIPFSDPTLDENGSLQALTPNIPWILTKPESVSKKPIDALEEYKKLMNVGMKIPSNNLLKNVPKNKITDEIINSDYSDEDKEYLIKLAKRESSYNPYITNQLGYYGLYQFGKSALKDTGFTKSDFNNTKNQHVAALKLAKLNEKRLSNIIDKHANTWYNGIRVTKNGIRAAAHLLGSDSVKAYFNGQRGKTDGNGTTIPEYLKLFQ